MKSSSKPGKLPRQQVSQSSQEDATDRGVTEITEAEGLKSMTEAVAMERVLEVEEEDNTDVSEKTERKAQAHKDADIAIRSVRSKKRDWAAEEDVEVEMPAVEVQPPHQPEEPRVAAYGDMELKVKELGVDVQEPGVCRYCSKPRDGAKGERCICLCLRCNLPLNSKDGSQNRCTCARLDTDIVAKVKTVTHHADAPELYDQDWRRHSKRLYKREDMFGGVVRETAYDLYDGDLVKDRTRRRSQGYGESSLSQGESAHPSFTNLFPEFMTC